MKIKLIDDYYLTTDPYNYILSQERIVQEGENKGKKYLDSIGFYATLPGLFEGLVNYKGLQSTAKSLKELVSEHQELLESIRELFPKVRKAIK